MKLKSIFNEDKFYIFGVSFTFNAQAKSPDIFYKEQNQTVRNSGKL